jgi:ABC-2 type transport system permease protein
MTTMTAPGRSASALALQRILAITIRHWYVVMRSPHRIFDIAVWPVVDAVLYSSIAMYMRQASSSAASNRVALSVVAGIIMWHVVYQSQIAVSTSFFEESYSRQVPSLFATPLRPVEWVLGAALQGMVKVVTGVSAVAVAGLLLYHFNILNSGLGIVPMMALLLLTGWAMAIIVLGLVLYLGSGSEALTWGLLFIVLPLSGALYPVSALPAIVRPVSVVLPTTRVFEAARAVATNTPGAWGLIGIAAIATAGLMAAAVCFAGFAMAAYRRRGFISRAL